MSIKKTLLNSASGVIPAEVKAPEPNIVNGISDFDMQPGDIVKIKQKDKTKSPYSTVVGFDHAAKQVNIKPIDALGSGNRQQRRANYKAKG